MRTGSVGALFSVDILRRGCAQSNRIRTSFTPRSLSAQSVEHYGLRCSRYRVNAVFILFLFSFFNFVCMLFVCLSVRMSVHSSVAREVATEGKATLNLPRKNLICNMNARYYLCFHYELLSKSKSKYLLKAYNKRIRTVQCRLWFRLPTLGMKLYAVIAPDFEKFLRYLVNFPCIHFLAVAHPQFKIAAVCLSGYGYVFVCVFSLLATRNGESRRI